MGKKKKKKKEKEDDSLKYIDKAFFELQIAELNRRIARLQSRCLELETEGENVRTSMEKCEEDKADIISHMKRSMGKKNDEIEELQERIEALMQAKEIEAGLYKEKIKTMDSDFKTMHEKLSSEIKLLTGKLNSLEEYRAHREELMTKFENQEKEIADQAKKHEKELSQMEKAYLIRKERLAQEMEERILKLSEDYQRMNQTRIASTTQGVIRENIAINNELNILVYECRNLETQVEDLKTKNKTLTIEAEIKQALLKSVQRKNVILTEALGSMERQDTNRQVMEEDVERFRKQINFYQTHIKCIISEKDKVKQNLGVAKQRLEAAIAALNNLRLKYNETEKHSFKLERVITDAGSLVKQVIKLSMGSTTNESIILKRVSLMKTLEKLLDVYEELEGKKSSNSRIKSGSDKISSVSALTTPKGPAIVTHTYSGSEVSLETSQPDTNISSDKELLLEGNVAAYIHELEEKLSKGRKVMLKFKELKKTATTKTNEMKITEERIKLLQDLDLILSPPKDILILTTRPNDVPSLHSVILEDGLLKMHDVPSEPEQLIPDIPTGTVEPCADSLLY